MANGYDVIAYDPAEGAKEQTRKMIERVWASLEEVGLAEGASADRLTFVPTLKEAVANADFVQENVPEREELKKSVLTEIDLYTRPEVIIGSSTSGIMPTVLQKGLIHPGRKKSLLDVKLT